jgi:hypothetical protein
MFNIDRIARNSVSAVGALLLTTVAVGAAIGPAAAAPVQPVFATATAGGVA